MTVTADPKRVIDQWGEMPPAIPLDDYAGAPLEQRSTDFEGTLSGNGTAARGLSLFLLDLYALANRTGIGEFEHGFFRLLSQHLPFDAGWTGVTTHTANGPVMHNSFVYGLPGEFFTDWQRVRDCDPLALGSMNRYGRALEVSIVAPGIDPRFRNWAIKYGLAQLMVVSALDHRFGLATFLSVYRRALDKPFSAADAQTLEDVIPHLSAALTINRSFQLTRERGEGVSTPARAICDGFGAVHQADKAFETILRSEWPTYQNQHLPAPLIAHLHADTGQPYVGETVTVSCSPVVGLFQLEARQRSPLDRLSPRELSAIKLYGDGLSHKEVAQRMAISPTTVRHYLRCAYKKLGMHDKSQIPWLLGLRDNAAANAPAPGQGD
ncbi:response regulator transcription factor [Paraburkholderia sp.]|uniref:helix-turn-helix transcriptional regulator n=1 Tax=Paraburkholderia sp. TaxID=1926495 RepID=UPI003C7D2B7F